MSSGSHADPVSAVFDRGYDERLAGPTCVEHTGFLDTSWNTLVRHRQVAQDGEANAGRESNWPGRVRARPMKFHQVDVESDASSLAPAAAPP